MTHSKGPQDSFDQGGQEPSLCELIGEIIAGDPSIEEVLERVVALATRIIDSADGASLTLFRPNLQPYSMVASHDWVRAVDERQYAAMQGPCIEVAATSAPSSGSGDLAESTSWPVFGPAAADLGVRSILAVGLSPRPDHLNPASGLPGALNLYSRSVPDFQPAEQEEALVLAAIAGAECPAHRGPPGRQAVEGSVVDARCHRAGEGHPDGTARH
ncbi:MAG TPA: hypothetical protein GXZ30_04825 [Propionibacterium sp.]|nr:hypothetical protein [Propionibacterium sp.]